MEVPNRNYNKPCANLACPIAACKVATSAFPTEILCLNAAKTLQSARLKWPPVPPQVSLPKMATVISSSSLNKDGRSHNHHVCPPIWRLFPALNKPLTKMAAPASKPTLAGGEG